MGDELDELLGGPRVWCGWQFFEGLDREDPKPPILLYNNDVFISSPHLLSGAGTEDFGGRYAGCRLQLKSDEDVGFLVYSFHGRYTGLTKEGRLDHCDDFIRRVGEETVLTGFPAVIGGDWNAVINQKKIPFDDKERWVADLRRVNVFGPWPNMPRRFERDDDPIDYFCIVRPKHARPKFGRTTLDPTELNNLHVTARLHVLNVERYDHDPIIMDYSLSPPADAGGERIVDDEAEDSLESLTYKVYS
jgi:hypothetical protein